MQQERLRKIASEDVPREPAYHGAAEKQVYLRDGTLSSAHIVSMTTVYLQPDARIPWHHNVHIEETMLVVSGYGTVIYADETITFKPGDFFIFRDSEQHSLQNHSTEEAMFVFTRIISI